MAYPLWDPKVPGNFVKRGVISKEGRCLAREDVSPKHQGDISFRIEIGNPAIAEMAPDQKRTALAVLEQTVAEARVFLGEKPRTGFQPGMVVYVSSGKQKHLGVLQELNEERIVIQTFVTAKPEVTIELPRRGANISQASELSGIEGLAYAILFFPEEFKGMDDDFSQNDPSIHEYVAGRITDQATLAKIVSLRCSYAKTLCGENSSYSSSFAVRVVAIRRLEDLSVLLERIRISCSHENQRSDFAHLVIRLKNMLPSFSPEQLSQVVKGLDEPYYRKHREIDEIYKTAVHLASATGEAATSASGGGWFAG